MSKKYLLGFDAGTSGSKGIISDFSGNILDVEATTHDIIIPRPGYAEHDPIKHWWNDFKTIVFRLLKKTGIDPAEIAGIGCSAIACAATAVDAEGQPLRNAILYGIDTRSDEEIKELYERIGKEKIILFCGRELTSDSYGPKLLWIKNHEPDIFEKAHDFTFAQGFINFKLTGRNCIDVYSVSWADPFFNPDTLNWDEGMCKNLIDPKLLPKICWATEVIGGVTKEAAAETGLCEGTPVVCGTTDAGAEAISVGVLEPGNVMIMYGSTTFIIQVSNDPNLKDNVLWKSNYLFPGTYCILSAMATTGSLIKWIRNNMAMDLMLREEAGDRNAYDMMMEDIDTIPPGSEGVYVLPYFAGERMPLKDSKAKGMIFGLTLSHERKHIIRAAIEGIGYGLDQNLELIRSLGFDVASAVAVGGSTKSRIWMQIMSDICGCKQVIREVSIGAPYGDTMLAGLGIGELKSKEELKDWIKTKYVVTPDPEKNMIYEEKAKLFRELYLVNKKYMHQL